MERIMRKCTALLTAGALTLSGLYLSPAHATAVEYSCATGTTTGPVPTYTITTGVVSAGADCVGAVIIPEGVTLIGDNAFYNADGLTSVTIPASVEAIGNSAFNNTAALISINFSPGSRLTEIGANAFKYAEVLTSINIPASVESIGVEAFAETLLLETVTFASGSRLTAISESMFENARALTSINIPASITAIDDYAFYNAMALAQVTFAPGSQLRTIGKASFDATALTTITIPARVELIKTWAFLNTNRLDSIYFFGNAPIVEADAFLLVKVGAKVYGVSGFATEGELWNGLEFRTGVYTATYSSTGGTSVTFDRFISGGDIAAAPTPPTRTNYVFDGWSATDGGTAISFPYRPDLASDITLYAKWVIDPAYAAAQEAAQAAANRAAQEAATAAQAEAARVAAANLAAAELAARTIGLKKKFAIKPLAKQVSVPIVSPKAKVTFKVAKSSKKVCTKSGSKLKTLKAGNCVVTFTVQEPKPKKGKKPKATKTVKTLVVR
jgi:uncharacterized repeat protein (TIGR02543 family)